MLVVSNDGKGGHIFPFSLLVSGAVNVSNEFKVG